MHANDFAKFISDLDAAFRADDAEVSNKAAEARHVAIVQQQYRALMTQDFAKLVSLWHQEIDLEIVGPAEYPFTGRSHGFEEVMTTVARNFGYVAPESIDVLSVVAQGDVVTVISKEKGRSIANDRPYLTHWVQIFTIKEGQVARIVQIADSGPVLAAMQN